MTTFKSGRLAEDIKREIAILIRELKDPRIAPMLGVVKVRVSGDASHCKVYVSAIEGPEQTLTSIKGLQSASGHIKRELSNKLRLKKSPEIVFLADKSLDESERINKIIDELGESNED